MHQQEQMNSVNKDEDDYSALVHYREKVEQSFLGCNTTTIHSTSPSSPVNPP